MQSTGKTLQLDHQLLINLYATQQHEDQWTNFLDGLAAAVGVRAAAAQLIEWRGDGHECKWTARDRYSLARAQLHDTALNNQDNPRNSAGIANDPEREVSSDHWHFRNDADGFSRLRTRLQAAELGTAFWADFLVTPRQQFSLIFHREAGDERAMADEEEVFLRRLLPHLKQAVCTAKRLADAERRANVGQAIFEQVRMGIMVCDPMMQLVWLNNSATQVLHKCGQIGLRRGQLQGFSRQASQDLQRLFAIETGMKGNNTATFSLTDGGNLHVRSRVITEYHGLIGAFDDRNIVLFMSEPASMIAADPCELTQLFGMTFAEARLAAALANGMTIADYAASRGIAEGTARIQLKQVLAKTNSRRQAELVRQLCGSVLASPLTSQ